MEKESPKQHLWCPCSIHYNAKSDRILHGKYFLLQQNHIFMIEKAHHLRLQTACMCNTHQQNKPSQSL